MLEIIDKQAKLRNLNCHSGWMLIARFSNNDGKNWMADSGDWWYDRRNASGATTDPSVNAYMRV